MNTLLRHRAVRRTPSARATFITASKRGLAPGARALYRLSRPSPASLQPAPCLAPAPHLQAPAAAAAQDRPIPARQNHPWECLLLLFHLLRLGFRFGRFFLVPLKRRLQFSLQVVVL